MSSGWNRGTGAAAKPQPKKPSALRGIIAGVVCACLAAAVAFFVLSGRDEKPKAKVEKAAGLIKEVKPVKAADKTISSNLVKAVKKTAVGEMGKNTSATNGSETAKVAEKKSRPAFSLPGDQLMVMAQPLPGGLPPPPIPTGRHTTAQFQEAMLKKIEIRDTDSDEVRELKERVMECRREMMEALAQGRTVDEVLSEHQETLRYNFQVYNEQRAALKEIFDSGDVEGAQKFCDTMNVALREMGIQELRMPSKAMARKSELLRQRRAKQEGKEIPK